MISPLAASFIDRKGNALNSDSCPVARSCHLTLKQGASRGGGYGREGADRIRTGAWRFCRPLPYHLGTATMTESAEGCAEQGYKSNDGPGRLSPQSTGPTLKNDFLNLHGATF